MAPRRKVEMQSRHKIEIKLYKKFFVSFKVIMVSDDYMAQLLTHSECGILKRNEATAGGGDMRFDYHGLSFTCF